MDILYSIVSGILWIVCLLNWNFKDSANAVDTSKEGLVVEYCQGEDFQPSCDRDEVIVIQSAHYGSMKIGRCLAKDYGHLSCFTNVKDIADMICSGRRSCEIGVPNKQMDDVRTCQEDFTRYLEISFICRKVILPSLSQCRNGLELEASAKTKYLASVVTMETKCGVTDSPWILQAKPGQNINLTLFDFNHKETEEEVGEQGPVCTKRYGYLFDLESEEIVNICSGEERTRFLYISQSNQIHVLLDGNMLNDNHFLIKFEATGCPDPKLPANTWSKQEGHLLRVGCQGNMEEWTLRCHGNYWIGISKECKVVEKADVTNVIPQAVQIEETKDNHMENLLIVTIVGCVTLISCVLVIIIGVVCIKRLNHTQVSGHHRVDSNSQKSAINRDSLLTSYLPVFNPSQQNTIMSSYRMAPPAPGTEAHRTNTPCLLSHQSSGGEPCVCETQTYKSTSDRDSVQYYVLDQDYMANSSQMT